MINALRTLLLNVNGANAPGQNYPGEEYVPPLFNALVLPPTLFTVRQLLFGAGPDRAMLNYRLRELMAILHTGPLAEFVYALDPRVTYWLPRNNTLVETAQKGFVIQPGPAVTALLQLQGSILAPITNNQLYYSYTVLVIGSSHVTITPSFGGAPVTAAFTTTAGLSSIVTLPGSNVGVIFNPTIGANWQVTWLGQPNRTLADVDSNLNAGMTQDLVNSLFGVNPNEPYKTFLNLWQDNPFLPYRVGGLVLALGYRMNAILNA